MSRVLIVAYALAMLAFGFQPAAPYRWDLPKGFPQPGVPAANPMSEDKVRLGRYLFYDRRLSGNGTQSCASCHKQELAFTDGRAKAEGSTGESHPRSAMSLVNVAYSAVLTWSNPNQRALEEQALVPMLGQHPVELGLRGSETKVRDLLQRDAVYSVLFPKAFPLEKDPLTIKNVAKALAAFERTILSARSPYDRYHTGGDPDAIPESAKRGEVLYFTDPAAGCFRCHGGFYFSDATAATVEFHNTALYNPYPSPNTGIFEYTKRPADAGKFKAPTLRNIALTAPYMHDGSIATLAEVIDHYASGGRAPLNPLKDRRMTGFHLTGQNRADLLAFLESLTDVEMTHDPRFTNPWE